MRVDKLRDQFMEKKHHYHMQAVALAAYLSGRPIQYRQGYNDDWHDVDPGLAEFPSHTNHVYRIKPKENQ